MYRLLILHWIALLLVASNATAAELPNVLIVLADDCTYNDLPLYGGKNAKTPNIDAFARQGLVFDRAYLCSAMCQPCRSELYSGQYPLRNGCAWNHSASRDSATSLPNYLGQLGYRVGLAGKVHVLPDAAFPFESVGGFDGNCVRNPTEQHDVAELHEFMTRDTKKPFCLVVALVEPHVPWVMGDASQYPEAEIELPPNIADTDLTREAYSRYLAEISYMDEQFGEILQSLELAGQADNTLVLFSSEQGSQFPGCKWTNWDTGVHTALIARWPDNISPQSRTQALVQYADVAPTLIEACGGQPADWVLDGTSFLSVLQGKTGTHRDYVYGMHNNVPEGPSYPIRSISDGQYHYIRNLTPDELFIEKHLMGLKDDGLLNNPYWGTWIWDSQANERTYRLAKRYMLRPAEELYRLQDDAFEMNNLAGQAELEKVRRRLASELDAWMSSQGDPGAAQDSMETLRASRRGEHRFFPPGT